jgi:uncharacterized Fe-S radical SAM superfamily protein PflX
MEIDNREAHKFDCPMKMTNPALASIKCCGDRCMAWRWYGADSGYCGMAATPLSAHKELIHIAAKSAGDTLYFVTGKDEQ